MTLTPLHSSTSIHSSSPSVFRDTSSDEGTGNAGPPTAPTQTPSVTVTTAPSHRIMVLDTTLSLLEPADPLAPSSRARTLLEPANVLAPSPRVRTLLKPVDLLAPSPRVRMLFQPAEPADALASSPRVRILL